jgi:hypothetical protein
MHGSRSSSRTVRPVGILRTSTASPTRSNQIRSARASTIDAHRKYQDVKDEIKQAKGKGAIGKHAARVALNKAANERYAVTTRPSRQPRARSSCKISSVLTRKEVFHVRKRQPRSQPRRRPGSLRRAGYEVGSAQEADAHDIRAARFRLRAKSEQYGSCRRR